MTNKERVIKEFNLKPFGTKGWFSSKQVACPQCERSDKFGIKFNSKGGGSVHCFYDEYKTSLYNYLKKIGKKDLLQFNKEPELEILKETIEEDILNNPSEATETPLKSIKKPFGCKPLQKDDEYLKSRYFTEYHYKIFEPSYVRLHSKIDKTYIVFFLYQEGNLVGWLARSRNSKEWHDRNLKASKEGKEDLKLRYYNSSEIEFSHILGGYDEITANTEILILVEGLFDKVSIDTKLGLSQTEEVKCLCTWGNKISTTQAQLIKKKQQIKSTFVVYDHKTIEESKKATMGLYNEGVKNIFVGEIKKQNADPGDLTAQELDDILVNAKNFHYFYMNRIDINLK